MLQREHKYYCKYTKQVKKVLRRVRKTNTYVWEAPELVLEVGDRISRNGEYYGTLASVTKTLYFFNDENNPDKTDKMFLKNSPNLKLFRKMK